MKLNISVPKTAKTYSIESDEKTNLNLLGKKIKDEVSLDFLGKDYKGIITGGSNKQGFPMMSSLDNSKTKKILLKGPFGFKPSRKGQRKRKRVAPKYIDENTQQINIKLTSGDSKILDEKYTKKEKKE